MSLCVLTKALAEPTTQSTQGSLSVSNQASNNAVNSPNKWLHPKPFKDESDEIKLSMVLKWIFGGEPYGDVLTREKKVTNITVRLEKMNFNGYLRVLGIDAKYLMDYMSETSRTLFADYKSKHLMDEWKCPQCASFFKQDALKWKCARCLFWYHEKCTKERKILRTNESQEDYSLCDSCFFAL